MRAWWRIGSTRPSRRPPGVHVYIAKNGARAVVAALAVNGDGVYLEQPALARRLDPPEAAALGEAFIAAWDAFREDAPSAAGARRSAWPALEASGARSAKAFEADYLRIECFACNASGAIIRASAAHPVEDGIDLSIAFNPRSHATEIGTALLRLFAVARGNAAGS